jgi:hypothetical protein
MALQPIFNEGIAASLIVAALGNIVPCEADGEDASPSPVRSFGAFLGRSDHIREITAC